MFVKCIIVVITCIGNQWRFSFLVGPFVKLFVYKHHKIVYTAVEMHKKFHMGYDYHRSRTKTRFRCFFSQLFY